MENQTLDGLLEAYGAPIFEMSDTVNDIFIDIKVFVASDGTMHFYQTPQIEECDITNTMATIILELLLERPKQVSSQGLILHLRSALRDGKATTTDEDRIKLYERMMQKMIDDLELLNTKTE